MTFLRHLTNVCRAPTKKNIISNYRPFVLSNTIEQSQKSSKLLFKNNVIKRNLASEAEKKRKHDHYAISVTTPMTQITPDDIGPLLGSKISIFFHDINLTWNEFNFGYV